MRCRAAAVACLLLLLLASCAGKPERRGENIFQSPCTITLYDRHGDGDFQAVWDRLAEIDAMMSMWKPESALSRINAASGSGPVPAPPEILAALDHALTLADLTGGRYDPTVGPLVKLWAIGTPNARVPAQGEIAAALALLGRSEVRVDRGAGTVALGRPGMALDFGSVAKGFGAVEAGKVLESRGMKSAVVDVGGCVLAFGSRPDGSPWRIGVQDPSGERGAALVGYFLARDSAASTSGIYERRFVSDGVTYHHLMDTTTGYPIDNDIVSVTVLTDRRKNPDGPPLAILALGTEGGVALADRLGLPAVLILKDRSLRLSRAAEGIFTLTNRAYTLGGPTGGPGSGEAQKKPGSEAKP